MNVKLKGIYKFKRKRPSRRWCSHVWKRVEYTIKCKIMIQSNFNVLKYYQTKNEENLNIKARWLKWQSETKVPMQDECDVWWHRDPKMTLNAKFNDILSYKRGESQVECHCKFKNRVNIISTVITSFLASLNLEKKPKTRCTWRWKSQMPSYRWRTKGLGSALRPTRHDKQSKPTSSF